MSLKHLTLGDIRAEFDYNCTSAVGEVSRPFNQEPDFTRAFYEAQFKTWIEMEDLARDYSTGELLAKYLLFLYRTHLGLTPDGPDDVEWGSWRGREQALHLALLTAMVPGEE